MAAIPYIPLYIADYLSDTAYLDATESGAYLHLIFNYWQTGKPLPDDDKKLARIAKLTDEQWLNIRSTVVQFFIQKDGFLTHKRIETELRTFEQKSKKASKAGKKSGEARRKRSLESKGADRGSTNERSTDVKQTLNHTDTDTDTDSDADTRPLKDIPYQEKNSTGLVDTETGEVIQFRQNGTEDF